MLAYFYLLTLTAILAMVLGGEILIVVGGPKFASVAPLVPLTAAAMSMPALFRTIAMSATYNNRRKIFVSSAVFVGCSYLAFCIGFLSFTNWGIYSPPAAMICRLHAALEPDVRALAVREKPIKFPYALMVEATLVAVALAVWYHFAHPAGELIQLPFIAAVMILWLCLLFVLRIIPKHHWGPIQSHRPLGAGQRSSALQFNQRAGLRAIGERRARRASRRGARPRPGRHARARLRGRRDRWKLRERRSWMVHPDTEGARLVRLLRTAGSEGGIPTGGGERGRRGVSLYLFSDQPVAVRLRRMRQLLSAGVDPHELRTLDDLRNDLAKANDTVWTSAARTARRGAPKITRAGRQAGQAASARPKRA